MGNGIAAVGDRGTVMIWRAIGAETVFCETKEETERAAKKNEERRAAKENDVREASAAWDRFRTDEEQKIRKKNTLGTFLLVMGLLILIAAAYYVVSHKIYSFDNYRMFIAIGAAVLDGLFLPQQGEGPLRQHPEGDGGKKKRQGDRICTMC